MRNDSAWFHYVEFIGKNTGYRYSIGLILVCILLFRIKGLEVIKTIWHDSIMYIYVRVENLYIFNIF